MAKGRDKEESTKGKRREKAFQTCDETLRPFRRLGGKLQTGCFQTAGGRGFEREGISEQNKSKEPLKGRGCTASISVLN